MGKVVKMGFFSSRPKKEKKKPTKKEDSKDDLLKDREKLIRISATFLAKPEVEKESLELRKAFLKRKGLTEEEIQKAFEAYKEKKKLEIEEQELKKELDSYKDGQGDSKKNLEKKIERAKKSGFLSLKGFELSDIPAEVLDLLDLRTLVLSDNPLGRVPEEIEKLKNLRILHLVNCDIGDEGIPEQLFTLEHLQELNLSQNHINDPSNLLTRFPNLVRLNLSDNDVLAIDDALNLPGCLQSLNFERNNLSELPRTIGELPNLKVLRVRGNNIDPELLEMINKKGPSALLTY